MILNIWLEAWEHHRGFLKAGLGLINLHAPSPLPLEGLRERSTSKSSDRASVGLM